MEPRAKVGQFRPGWLGPRREVDITYDRYARDPETRSFYGSPAWRKLRKSVIEDQPLCPDCLEQGVLNASQEVHHLKPIKTHPHLKLVRENLIALCRRHHKIREQR